MRDLIYSKLKRQLKSFKPMLARRRRECNVNRLSDAYQQGHAEGFWEGRIEGINEMLGYLEQWRKSERKTNKPTTP